jgi:hypothetical protein
VSKGIAWVTAPFILNDDDPAGLFRPLEEAGLEVRLAPGAGRPMPPIPRCLSA